ncbi:hypothetical protein EVAR_22033_1 [Eumeta japonica]|uniref:Uncharacterized protein n=1 Tax=Eumeta variegata TaxID=151549 RepID=A0A4C1USH7_EUMVA|nr:hypothetical protein EVAR_22033_1 [Eumeta japonica]
MSLFTFDLTPAAAQALLRKEISAIRDLCKQPSTRRTNVALMFPFSKNPLMTASERNEAFQGTVTYVLVIYVGARDVNALRCVSVDVRSEKDLVISNGYSFRGFPTVGARRP